ncbi:MAG: hypothetical protein U5P41_15580 [Gammaproteobacteria bacterium]|nr:hypothetical protein [Gammaproteobacteria bacterium]
MSQSKDLNSFKCKDINPEFGKGSFSFKKSEIMAMDEPKLIYIDRDLFKPVSSVFQLVKSDDISGYEWHVSLDEHKVTIKVSPDAKEMIERARNSTNNKAVLLNSLYFSAAMEAVTKLKSDDDEYNQYKWARVIKQQCHNRSIDIDNHDSYLITQKLMSYPLNLLKQYQFKGDA